MTPFHRPCALYSFLSVCNVTIVPSCTIFKLLEVEKYCELKSRLWVTHPICQCMHDLYIGGSYRREAVFLPLIVCVYLHLLLHSGLAELWKKLQCCVTVVQRHKVIQIGTQRKSKCDFLLVSHCNRRAYGYLLSFLR